MNEFKRRVKEYIKVHKLIHGKADDNAVAKDLFNSFGYDEEESIKEINRLKNVEFGIFIGRCQPFTNGHNEIIQDIIRDGKIPIILLGSTNIKNEKNPLNYDDRKYLIEKIYGEDILITGLEDKEDWEEWYNIVEEKISSLGIDLTKITLYSHIKSSDYYNFEYKRKKYTNESYVKIFEENNIKIKKLEEVVCSLGETIHASDVRANENIAIRNLDARIYRELKDKFKWWS